jgi:uncharacterized protein VirK/YbjX
MLTAARHRWSASKLLHASPGTLLEHTVHTRPEILGFVTAPYFCADWTPAERIEHYIEHIGCLETFGPCFGFATDESVELMQLDLIGPAYHVVLDKPIWFHREGVLVLNLFRDNVRMFSLAFALSKRPAELTALIGAIQGRNLDGILEEYRVLTKAACGLRPRDLLIELFRTLCRQIGVLQIHAISDACRAHRSPFFGPVQELSLNYDEVWTDRGGIPLNRAFFTIPVERQVREVMNIPSNKRAMYRKRYALLDELEARMSAGLRNARPIRRPEAE